jgi:hypothetical protein
MKKDFSEQPSDFPSCEIPLLGKLEIVDVSTRKSLSSEEISFPLPSKTEKLSICGRRYERLGDKSNNFTQV